MADYPVLDGNGATIIPAPGYDPAYVVPDTRPYSRAETYAKSEVYSRTEMAARARRMSLMAMTVIPGRYYDQTFNGSAGGTVAGAANRLDMSPFFFPVDFACDRMGLYVTTGVASAKAKIALYDADDAGKPTVPLLYSAELDVATSSTFVEDAAAAFSFVGAKLYWIGVHHSSTATLRSMATTMYPDLGRSSADHAGTASMSSLRRTVSYAGGALPNPWVFDAAEFSNANLPEIRMRAA